jgi:hypothetical protein
MLYSTRHTFTYIWSSRPSAFTPSTHSLSPILSLCSSSRCLAPQQTAQNGRQAPPLPRPLLLRPRRTALLPAPVVVPTEPDRHQALQPRPVRRCLHHLGAAGPGRGAGRPHLRPQDSRRHHLRLQRPHRARAAEDRRAQALSDLRGPQVCRHWQYVSFDHGLCLS